MGNINVAVLGDPEFAKELGKKGSVTDFSIYNYKSDQLTAAFMVPTSYPDKLQSLTNVLAMADAVILVVKAMNKELGEFIIALDLLGFKRGLIMFDEYVEKDKFISLVKGTTLESFIVIDKSLEEIYPRLAAHEIPKPAVEHVVVDAAFDVKSVGTVVLGVSRGNFAVHDELQSYPEDKKASIRSIQVHDKDVKNAVPGDRVGFSLKGVTVEEVERGHMLARPGTLQASDTLTAKWKQSKYFTEKLEAGMHLFAAIGLQYRAVVIEKIEGDGIVLKADRKVAYAKGSSFLLLKPESKMRIAGVVTLL
ncbi:Elongation factor 1-alpha [uncultured archaeon]|nr:Elongation factor 1-alpha [uncultured archaeon]